MAKDRQKVIQAAEKLAARGRIQAAIDEYRKVLDRHPNDTTTLNRVGDLYVRLNRLPKAIDLFQKTAESFGRQGFFVKAIAIYKKMIRLDPGQIKAYEALADLYNRQGLTGDSLAQYQVVADYYLKHDNLEAALGVHQSMVEIEPENPSRRLQLAEVLQKEGNLGKAQEQYQAIADLMLEHSRGEDAAKVLGGAIDVDSGNLDFVRHAMHSLQNAGFDQLADDLLESAILRNPQANALRLDTLESAPAAGLEPESPPKVEEAVEEAVAEEEPTVEVAVEAVDEVDEADQTGADETEVSEPSVEVESSEVAAESAVAEIEISELEELPEEGLDPVGTPQQPEAGTGVDPVVELEAPDGESSFELEDSDAPAAAAPDDDFSFELDIDEVSAQLSDSLEDAGEIIPKSDLTTAAPETTVPPPVAEAPQRSKGEWTKLLIESDVLGRYGMNEMASGVLERVLKAEPEHLGALTRMALLQLAGERLAAAVAVADGVAGRVAAEGAPDRWEDLCAALSERGYELEADRFVGEAPAAPVEVEEPAADEAETPDVEIVDIEAVEVEEGEAEEAAEADEAEEADEAPTALSLEAIVKETAALSRPKRPTAADSADGILAEVIEEIERTGDKDEEPVETPSAAEETPAEPVAEEAPVEAIDGALPDPSDVEWIRELERADSGASDSTAPLEPGTGEFVDLATELEAELSDDDAGFEGELLPAMSEQSLEDIVEGFRQGMAETLAEEDYDTHYNLGIAYREMGLLDEAIGEFQLAAKDPRYLVECCSLLASCFVDKNFTDLAVQWYARGIESSAIDEESKCGLLYELGSLLAAIGEPEAARERFLELYGINSNYRDVVAKLEELPS